MDGPGLPPVDLDRFLSRFRRAAAAPATHPDDRVAGNRPLVFDYTDPDPYLRGWVAFRTVASHFHIQDFTVWRPPTV
ncbi:hypothetical protein GCM10010168_68870 [Actinoplanes ianthinogenes]|uniref:DUF6250 domain-containing protein n=1 Tax=Actinoplanes ianthinogenes TaxID=122358 RepID=A0ABM7M0H0_9ACTN|nr:hypothetical protein Aiant_57440 [Actinoplanes ianthinogenes]GGR40490.1 hypothetical protein GCM10010168_68870 [Actinoplanes ianthinogenes]